MQMFLQMSLSRGHSCYLLATQNLSNAKFSICARDTDPAIKTLTKCAHYLYQSEKENIIKLSYIHYSFCLEASFLACVASITSEISFSHSHLGYRNAQNIVAIFPC